MKHDPYNPQYQVCLTERQMVALKGHLKEAKNIEDSLRDLLDDLQNGNFITLDE